MRQVFDGVFACRTHISRYELPAGQLRHPAALSAVDQAEPRPRCFADFVASDDYAGPAAAGWPA